MAMPDICELSESKEWDKSSITLCKSLPIENYTDVAKYGYYRILVIGEIGSGKSATINTILSRRAAESKQIITDDSVTKKLQFYHGSLNGSSEKYVLVDTPELNKDLIKSKEFRTMLKLGFHGVIVTFKLQRLTTDSLKIFKAIENLFSDDIYKFIILVLTHKSSELNIQDVLEAKNVVVQEFLTRINKRVVEFDNRTDNPDQIHEFQTVFNQMHSYNEGAVFSDTPVKNLLERLGCTPGKCGIILCCVIIIVVIGGSISLAIHLSCDFRSFFTGEGC